MAIDLDRLMSRHGDRERPESGDERPGGSQLLDMLIREEGLNQRWRHRRDFYRPATEAFDPEHWRVDLMGGAAGLPGDLGRRNTFQVGRQFIVGNHYAGSFPQVRVMVGMFRARNGELVGVATFSNVKKDQATNYGSGMSVDDMMELSRFVLLDEVPGNAETWFLSRATELARELHAVRGHQLKAVLSYSDPVPRQSTRGYIIMPGHVGAIYQAHNATFVGRSRSKTLYLDRRGNPPDPRMISKLRSMDRPKPERGGETAARRLVEDYGAPPRNRGESYIAWVKRALSSSAFRALHHPGNLTYLWAVGGKGTRVRVRRRFPESEPYPKTPRQLYLNLERRYQRAWSRGEVGEATQIARRMLAIWVGSEVVSDDLGLPKRLDKDSREGLSAPPQIGATCAAPVGSRSVQRSTTGPWTLSEVMAASICRS